MRSDLSGNATTPFDWGYIGGGQLSLALLADYFGSDEKAKAMAQTFEEHVIAVLPEVWTMTSYRIAKALKSLVGVDGARAEDVEADGNTGAAFPAQQKKPQCSGGGWEPEQNGLDKMPQLSRHRQFHEGCD
jgi:hypothetical protein